jgi:hypothetical protein
MAPTPSTPKTLPELFSTVGATKIAIVVPELDLRVSYGDLKRQNWNSSAPRKLTIAGRPLGSAMPTRSDRCRQIAEPLIETGFRCPITTRLRNEVWVKPLENVAFNPISALTGTTQVEMVQHSDVVVVVRPIMAEAEAEAGNPNGVRMRKTSR